MHFPIYLQEGLPLLRQNKAEHVLRFIFVGKYKILHVTKHMPLFYKLYI